MPIRRASRRRTEWVLTLVVLTVGAAVTGYAAARRSLQTHPLAPLIVAAPPVTPRSSPTASGGYAAPASAEATAVPCTEAPPDPTFTCQAGVWAAGKGGTEAPGGGGPGRTAGCVSAQPSTNLVCQNGIWVEPSSDGATSSTVTSSTASPSSSSTTAGQNTSACVGSAPSADWVCSGGVWMLKSAVGSAAPRSSQACAGPDPSAGRPGVTATCVNGVWVIH